MATGLILSLIFAGASLAKSNDNTTTPLTSDNKTVSTHVQKARGIISYAFRHRNWQKDNDWTNKRQRRVERHKKALLTPKPRREINQYQRAKEASYKRWTGKQKFKANPWSSLYRALSPERKAALRALSACEGSGNYGEFGWTHWFAVRNLIPASLFRLTHANVLDASYKEQAVVSSAVADRYGFGGWPECSHRLGL